MPGIFQTKQSGSCVVEIIRLDQVPDAIERKGPIDLVRYWLGLDAGEYRAATSFLKVIVGCLAGNVFVAALAVAE